MFKGFYNLTSGMLTQQQNLNVVANNMVNISTAGYKGQQYTATTFDEVMYARVGNKEKDYQALGQQSYIRATSQIYTNYDQGTPEPTGLPLDFALGSEGFFAVQRTDGQVAYTRAGSFSIDEEGYLCLPGQGRVLDPQGQEIQLNTDRVIGDSTGRIYSEADNTLLGQIGVYDFDDYSTLVYDSQGLFTGEGATVVETPDVYWSYLERSNVDMVDQMTEMMTCQRAFQSAAQLTKMYDQIMTKATTELGRL
jgi:flagellar basal-body rod protein FlgG